MNAEELKNRLRELFGEQVIFNKEFDCYVENIKNNETLLEWCNLVKDRKIKPISKSVLKEKIVFIKKRGGSTRCIIVKIINGEVKEIHLADHDYYDKLTKELGIKDSSKTY